MAKKVRIDEDECIGCESCVEICPDVFTFNDDTDKAEVIDENLAEEECVDEAVASCPSECIYVDEE
jgi:ferredoxin